MSRDKINYTGFLRMNFNNNNSDIRISTPGRICLFGEHQDYLGLPVIASGISLRIFIEGSFRKDCMINISLPDVNGNETFYLNGKLNYKAERDYFKSAVNVLLQKGFTFSRGLDCKVYGQIPINAGASSSSALIVTWINLLTRLSDQSITLSPEEIAELAYKAEVEEFNEPGGKMDHYSTAIGNIIELESYPAIKISKIRKKLGAFVLGNSGEPKDTKHVLSKIKNKMISITENLRLAYKDFSLHHVNLNDVEKYKKYLQAHQFELLIGTIINRDITREALGVLNRDNFNQGFFGELMYKHHSILRDVLKISTEKIDGMIEAAMQAGALGAKINGSGGGGCMFAYAPENPEEVFEAVKKISGEAYLVYSCEGTREEVPEKI
jgi:galactokinase